MHARADPPIGRRGEGDLTLTQDLPGQPDGRDDLDIAGAAAVVVADGKTDLRLRGVGAFVQKPLAAEHHAGDAEAALDGTGLAEGEGERGLFKVAQTLDREHVLALKALRVGNAGAAGLALDQNGAGAACALAASVLDRSQAKLVAQVAQKLLLLRNRDLFAVYEKCRHAYDLFSCLCRKHKQEWEKSKSFDALIIQ